MALLLLMGIGHLFLVHLLDARVFYLDAGRLLGRSLNLVDLGEWSWTGNPFFGELRLGPGANLLAAVPLLFTRNIFAQYYFLTLMLALAVPLYFAACWSLRRKGLFKWVATIIFAQGLLLTLTPLAPVNTQYLPLFLAAIFYLLVKSSQRKAWARCLVWPVLGLAMQLHLATALLALPALAVAEVRRRRGAPWFLLGFSLLVLLQYPVLRQLWPLDTAVWPAAGAGRSGPELAGAYGGVLLKWLLLAPFLFGLAGAFYLLPSLAVYRRLHAANLHEHALLQGSLWFIAAALLVFPPLIAIKGIMQYDYLYPGLIIAGFLGGLFAQYLQDTVTPAHRLPLRRHFGIFLVLVLITETFALLRCAYCPPDYFEMLRLHDQVEIADRLAATIRRQDYHSVQTRNTVYDSAADLAQPRAFSPYTYRALLLYRHPDLRECFTQQPERIVHVYLTPREETPGRLDACRPPDQPVLDRFDTEHLSVLITEINSREKPAKTARLKKG